MTGKDSTKPAAPEPESEGRSLPRMIRPIQFMQLTRPLIGLPVSKTWAGYGSAIFLELGALHLRQTARDGSVTENGEATVMLEWSWRVEGPRSVKFGS